MMQRINYRHIMSYLVVGALLFGAGWGAHGWYQRHDHRHKGRRVALQGFRFTSPLLDVELPEGVNITREPIPFKYKVEAYVQRQVKTGRVRKMAVYYRDLLDGPWFGINEDEEFNPASMMKVPVMIAWLKRAEADPQVLERTFVFDKTKKDEVAADAAPGHSITPGQSYRVKELLRYMMNYSDNRAMILLFERLNTQELNAVLDGMDIDNRPKDSNNSISVHGYSGFFRILYNGAFLNRDMSEKALELLSLQDFPQGIAAGVPKGIPVAAKYGVDEGGAGKDAQLHEFGIVYHRSQPYILGIMTQGHDLDRQAEILREISRMVYVEVDSAVLKSERR